MLPLANRKITLTVDFEDGGRQAGRRYACVHVCILLYQEHIKREDGASGCGESTVMVRGGACYFRSSV